MAEPVRWGILSTARINGPVLAGARESDAVEVVAVASREQASADAYAREHAIPRAHGSYDALLTDPEVEAIYISLPNSLHVEWSIRALEAGKHVLCEKPLSARPAEVERAFDTAERCERLLMEAFMWRHNPQTGRLLTLLGEGAIGPLAMVRASFGFHLFDAANVRMRRELEGGSLMDVGCYCVSALRLLCGEPVRVFGEQLLSDPPSRGAGGGVDVAFAGVLAFEGEVRAHFDSRLRLQPARRAVAVRRAGQHAPQRPLARALAGDRAAPRLGRRRADRDRARQLLPPGVREPLRGDPRRGAAAARPRGRARAGPHDRRALRLSADAPARRALTLAPRAQPEVAPRRLSASTVTAASSTSAVIMYWMSASSPTRPMPL